MAFSTDDIDYTNEFLKTKIDLKNIILELRVKIGDLPESSIIAMALKNLSACEMWIDKLFPLEKSCSNFELEAYKDGYQDAIERVLGILDHHCNFNPPGIITYKVLAHDISKLLKDKDNVS